MPNFELKCFCAKYYQSIQIKDLYFTKIIAIGMPFSLIRLLAREMICVGKRGVKEEYFTFVKSKARLCIDRKFFAQRFFVDLVILGYF